MFGSIAALTVHDRLLVDIETAGRDPSRPCMLAKRSGARARTLRPPRSDHVGSPYIEGFGERGDVARRAHVVALAREDSSHRLEHDGAVVDD